MRSGLSTIFAHPPKKYNTTKLYIGRCRVQRCHPRCQRAAEAVARGSTRRHLRGGVEISSMGWADRGFGKIKEEERSRKTPSSVVRMGYAPPLRCRPDCQGLLLIIVDISTFFLLLKFCCILWVCSWCWPWPPRPRQICSCFHSGAFMLRG